jgi:DNA-binding Lrp family transcriptional regulator
MSQLDAVDKKIINRIQDLFPIEPRPFRALATELGLSEKDIISRIRHLKNQGIIRRIGGNFSPDRLGFFSTLCAARVTREKLDLFTRTVNAYTGVTHNYMRNHTYNVWFTFIAPARESIEESLREISEATGVTDILNLPATHMFKISAKFKV